MNKKKAVICTILLSILFSIVFIASCFIEIEHNVPLAVIFYPVGLGYLFGDLTKSFYKWLTKNKESEVQNSEYSDRNN